MCGIVSYLGDKQAVPILIKGLERLEYRGYDSAGVAILNGELNVYKKKGKVEKLKKHIGEFDPKGTIGIGHTRWATHGEPNDVNAHPHTSSSGKIALVHNGIIENYSKFKKILTERGVAFKSDTDTEVLVQLIEYIKEQNNLTLEAAVRATLNEVNGAYAIVVFSTDEPDTLVAARKSSPLVIGIGENEYFLASDATPIIEYTRNVVYMEDEQVAIINRKSGLTLKSISNELITPFTQEVEMEIEALEKGGYEHFMLKEIFEQPKSIADSFRGRLKSKQGTILLGGVTDFENKILGTDKFTMVACGTSWHSCLVAEYLFEDLARVPVEVEYASEFRYRNPIVSDKDVVIAVSQSGETADTLAAIRLAKEKEATIYGICNVVGSSISRETHAGSYTHAGPEIGVASTKAFTAQITVLTLMALYRAEKTGSITKSRFHQILNEFELIPGKVEEVLKVDPQIQLLAEEFKDAENFLYLGRGLNFPVALEGALKLKEISYIHAEGYPAAEMKHGPIALIDENMPVVVLATNKSAYEKILSNIQEVKARKGKVIAIVTKGDVQIKEIADHVIEIPETEETLTPLLSVIPLQLLAYHIALLRGCNVDQPRNLAKSVTVE